MLIYQGSLKIIIIIFVIRIHTSLDHVQTLNYIMNTYENLSREELIQRIKVLETDIAQYAMKDAEIEKMNENLLWRSGSSALIS